MSWLGRSVLWGSAVSRSALRAPASGRAFFSRIGETRAKSVRSFATTASLGFSLLGLFSARSVSDVLGTSESSSIVREASPAVTKQPYTLVFVSSTEWGVPRDKYVRALTQVAIVDLVLPRSGLRLHRPQSRVPS